MKKLFFTVLVSFLTTMFFSCSEVKEEESLSFKSLKYLAVQMGKGDNWSIIDATGKVVVKEEYAPEDRLSPITNSGVYWVKSQEKYQLYSIASPKKSICKTEFDDATPFVNGVSLVSILGEPIQIINEEGKIIATLPKTVVDATTFSQGMSVITDKEGKKGYINTDGEIVINFKYKKASDFSEGKAFVSKEDDGLFDVIDKKGNVLFTLKDLEDYESFSNGLCLIEKKRDENRFEIIDAKGETVNRIKKNLEAGMLKDGFVLVKDKENDAFGVLNTECESVIRSGKYEFIYNIGNGRFLARKNNKFGIIDKDDNTLIDFDYENMLTCALGDYFLLKQGSYFYMVNERGEEIKNVEFYSESYEESKHVTFVDLKSIADGVANLISDDGYSPLKGKTLAKDICPSLGQDPESANYKYEFTLKSRQADR